MTEKVAETTGRGIAREQAARFRDRVEPPADELKLETARLVENVAQQVRELGRQLDRDGEAHAIARRLERSSDYLRYRPSGAVATDAWDAVTQPRVLWLAGGALAALVTCRILKARSD
ncbi:MAG: hypothetical protein V2I67_18700 [Thermoanaerobaculales bacterium]|nr:hypothetical protein [Thermoanaerobaculales bacterium]